MKATFIENRPFIENEYQFAHWIEDSGLPAKELSKALTEYVDEHLSMPMPLLRANAFRFLIENAQIEINPHSVFPDKINIGIDYTSSAGRDLFNYAVYSRFHDEVLDREMHDDFVRRNLAFDMGVCMADSDYWHTLPDWQNVMTYGVAGLKSNAEEKREVLARSGELTEKQDIFYQSVIISYEAILRYIERLIDASLPYDMPEYTACLRHLLTSAPADMYEVLELAILFLNMEEIGVERARSFGRIDQIYYPFYKNDLENGTFTKEQIMEMFRYFYMKCQAAKRFADQPFAICGVDANGEDATNELTWLLLEVYDGLGIHNPKIHVCCHPKMPKELLYRCLRMIRSGSSSICLINGEAIITAYEKIGIHREESQLYVPFGCYEPILMGLEEPMIGASWLNIAKAVEFAMNGGRDLLTQTKFGADTPIEFDSFEAFYEAFLTQFGYIVEFTVDSILKQDRYHMQINPSPIYSGTLTSCIERGRDVFDCGLKYSNTSIKCCGIATTVDSLLMVKKFVFEKHALSFGELRDILLHDWAGNEILRQKILKDKTKYGNHIEEADSLARDIYKFAAGLIVNRENHSGGRFRLGCDTITHNILFGGNMGATPDGRTARSATSKNFCASNGMDRNGISAYMLSVLALDSTDFLDGAVLDFVLHPTMVEGEDGLEAMYRMVETYFRLGGVSIQGNIMDLQMLLDARRNPDKYRTLQVRVCGWNEYFVEMDEDVQDMFIRQLQVVQ